MVAKRLIGGLDATQIQDSLEVQANRLAFEGADELCLVGCTRLEDAEAAVRLLGSHVDLPLNVWLGSWAPEAGVRLLELGASRLVVDFGAEDALRHLQRVLGTLRLGVHLGTDPGKWLDRAAALQESGFRELVVTHPGPLDSASAEAMARLPLQIVMRGEGGEPSSLCEWLLSGGDGWLREPGSKTTFQAVKDVLTSAGLRVRT